MELFSEEQFSGKPLDHLGLIADKIDSLGIISFIDERLPLTPGTGVKTTMGERVAAMIFNGLGFIDTRLYMFPEFLSNRPVKRLFGKELDAAWFNDDAIGRCLDAIASYGTTKLFTELSFFIGLKKGYLGRSAHFDTTTLQLSGEYPGHDVASNTDSELDPGELEKAPVPARGYSKSHRHDLKQMVLNLATTGAAGFPVWMESHSGNKSDKIILPNSAVRMNEFCKGLSGVPDFLYVGDSAMYSNVLSFSKDIKWLSRVPENILQSKQLLLKDDRDLNWKVLPNGYTYHVTGSDYNNVKQRWVLIFSNQAYQREIKTLQRNIDKELAEYKNKWWHLSNELYSCAHDAEVAAKKLAKEMKYHRVQNRFVEATGYSGKGRPKKNAEIEFKGYKVEFSLMADEEKINKTKLKKGRFILATNELDKVVLPDSEVLKEYKAQSGTERGFKFIKDDSFQLDAVFLKTPKRIDALMMVMTLCLMVYGVSQYDLRKSLQETGETIPDQKRKPTDKPSLKWVYYLFFGVHELNIESDGKIKQIVINVNSVLKHILSHFGQRAREIYLNSA